MHALLIVGLGFVAMAVMYTVLIGVLFGIFWLADHTDSVQFKVTVCVVMAGALIADSYMVGSVVLHWMKR